MSARLTLAAVLLAPLLAACPKSTPPSAEDAQAAPPPSAAAPAEAAAPEKKETTFAGSYTAAPGALYIPEEKEYERVKQAKEDPTKLVGEGKLSIVVSPDGRVSGTIDSGPAAPAVIEGSESDGKLTATVRRKDPADEGLTGVLTGTTAGGKLSGAMELATADGSVLREAKVSAEPK